ncbi:hypothetical protein AB0F17_60435 [Nonomuraea sp. NPDC026600]|uniref:hypothetical protein n=1 Tax=Nonomuraea sp. NPDC026600 TaxID=3155363 RepID=UPI0034114240
MRRVTWLLSLALLSGCAAEPAAAPVSPKRSADPRPRMEQIKADCMKQRGFKYLAYIKPARPEPDQSTYEAMKTYRQKYGFGVFAQYVYPQDPLSGSIETARKEVADDPNMALVGKLNDSQLDFYNKAKNNCAVKATKEVLHKEVDSVMDGLNLMRDAKEELEAAEIDGDPELISLASGLADCLVGKGRRVPSTKPMALAERGFTAFWDLTDTLRDKKSEGQPLEITPAQARPYLDREVKEALEDLECGKGFYTRYAPKHASIEARVWGEYGPLLGR